MKESRYNYFTKDGDKYICLNGISGNVFSVSADAYILLKEILEHPENNTSNEVFSHSLYKLGFLIDDEFDEIGYLRNKYNKSIRGNYYHLIINPTQECNFRCWYCYENHVNGHMSAETIKRTKLLIEKSINRSDINTFELSWFGGEPLLYFHEVIYPIAKYTQNRLKEAGKAFLHSMTSNGYYLTNSIIASCKEIELKSIQITLDGNRELHNRTRNNNGEPSFDRILQNIINFCSFDAENYVILRINYTAEVINTGLKDVFEKIPENIRPQIKIYFQRVWQTIGGEKTTNALINHLDYIKDLGFPIINNSAFALFRGKLCYADSLNYANINYDGNVFRCTAREYKPENRLGYLNENGDIVWEDKEILEKVDSILSFENETCLKCKNLAICGGHCFSRRFERVKYAQKTGCVKSQLDTGVDLFLKQYYEMRCKRRKEIQ